MLDRKPRNFIICESLCTEVTRDLIYEHESVMFAYIPVVVHVDIN
jgi:hypothetical protein